MSQDNNARRPYQSPQFVRSFKLSQVTASAPVSGTTNASDRRLKTDIRLLGTTNNGIRLYAYRYIWSTELQVGVMAQDLLEHAAFAAAVSVAEGGYYVVDYAALGLDLPVSLDAWQAKSAATAKHAYQRPQFGNPISLTSITAQAVVSGTNNV